MAPSADFLEFLMDQLRGLGRITTRRMFSGAGLYCEGVIFALILRDTLYFKVDDGNRPPTRRKGSRLHLRARAGRCGSAPTGRSERLFDEPDEMLEWARRAGSGRRAAALKKRPRRRAKRAR